MNKRLIILVITVPLVVSALSMLIFKWTWQEALRSAIFSSLLWYFLLRYNAKNNKPALNPDPEKNGMVSDEETALKIAEVIWLSVYGGSIYCQKPFKAISKEDVWIVDGVAHAKIGGAPHIVIRKTDGKIIEVTRSGVKSRLT